MYYLCSKNKGADQLHGYREADLRLCFRLCRLLVFPCGGSNITFKSYGPTVLSAQPTSCKCVAGLNSCTCIFHKEGWWVQIVCCCLSILSEENVPRHEETRFFAYAKTKTQISCAVTAQLISAFVFAARIVQFLH